MVSKQDGQVPLQTDTGWKKRSISLASSVGLDHRNWALVFESRGDSQACLMLKMGGVVALPIFTLLALTGYGLYDAIQIRTSSEDAVISIQSYFKVDDLVNNLQAERGTTASYLSSGGKNNSSYQSLLTLRNQTNAYVRLIDNWPSDMTIDNTVLATKDAFMSYLQDYYSNRIGRLNITFEENIQFYTNITYAFMDRWQTNLVLPGRASGFSPLTVAVAILLRASDDIGAQRALGATFFTLCGFSASDYVWFMQLGGKANAQMLEAFQYDPPSKQTYGQQYLGSTLEKNITLRKGYITLNEIYGAECRQFPDSTKFVNSNDWFQMMTSYMNIMKSIRKTLTSRIIAALTDLARVQMARNVLYNSLVVASVTLVSLVLSVWYVSRMGGMIDELKTSAKSISQKSIELGSERKRVELLLGQLMPRQIVDQLKFQSEVKAEFFDNVTIYYSDIVGFTTISSLSNAFQVFSMLNSLYSAFDDCIDRRDVYKVATIGDAYMVASGLPHPTCHHAREIALLAVDILGMADKFQINHLPEYRINLRIGIHSGPAAAGVVGKKAPRYCLFGETVSIANLMESTGIQGKIQISEKTKLEIETDLDFNTELRKDQTIRNGSMMKTYWLTSNCDRSKKTGPRRTEEPLPADVAESKTLSFM